MGRVRLSLVWKMLLSFLLVVLVAVGVVAVLANQNAAREVRSFMFSGGMTDSQRLADTFAVYYQGRGSWDGVSELFSSPGATFGRISGPLGMHGRGNPMRTGLTLSDPSGQVIASNDTDATAQLSSAEKKAAIPVVVEDETVALLVVREGEVFGPAQNLIARVNRSIWLAGLVAGVLALAVGGGLAASLLRPISHLTSAAQDMAAGDLTCRVPESSSDEIGELSRAFNQMAENIERAETIRREMTADIAHELRNPLAILQARLEGIVDGVYPAEPESLVSVLDQSKLLNRIVADLSTLALADEGRLSLDLTKVTLGPLLERIAASHSGQAQMAGISIKIEASENGPIEILADPVRMDQILSNVLSNALRHTPEGGEVAIKARKTPEDGRVLIEISDSGEGIPEADLERVFDRLYRIDRGRSRQDGGSGLGLAIARKLVQAHGGAIWAANRPSGGAVFTISLPSAA